MWCLCESLYPYVLHPDWCQEGAAGLSQDGAETGQEGGQDEGEFGPEAASVSVSSGAERDKREALVTFCPVHALDWGLPRSSFNHFGRYLISLCPEPFFSLIQPKRNKSMKRYRCVPEIRIKVLKWLRWNPRCTAGVTSSFFPFSCMPPIFRI